jgi:hypothetical protein
MCSYGMVDDEIHVNNRIFSIIIFITTEWNVRVVYLCGW